MKKIAHILTLLISLVAISCDDQSIDMGTVTYHPSFLWSDADTIPLVKTFEFDFSDDAKADPSVFAEFTFVNNDGTPLTQEDLIVFVDGVELKENVFRVTSSDSKKEIKYIFPPTVEGGTHQGYLKLTKHNLHRIGNEQLTPDQTADVFQWTIYFDKRCNPVKKVLMWIVGIVVLCILVWKFIGSKIVYPRFRAINKVMIISNQAPIPLYFKDKRMIVIDNQQHKQSLWNRFWTGEIQYIQNRSITTRIKLKPVRRGSQIMFIANGTNYVCTPNPIGIQPSMVKDIINRVSIYIR